MNAPVSNPELARLSSKSADASPEHAAQWTAGEWFARIMVVAAGFILGAIAAFITALFAGWIEFGC